jgi:hypothetical protein
MNLKPQPVVNRPKHAIRPRRIAGVNKTRITAQIAPTVFAEVRIPISAASTAIYKAIPEVWIRRSSVTYLSAATSGLVTPEDTVDHIRVRILPVVHAAAIGGFVSVEGAVD